MAARWYNRVRDTATFTGTGSNIIVSGSPPSGYNTFSSRYVVGDLIDYTAVAGNQWETGQGQYISANTIQRLTAYDSSTGLAQFCNFSAGTKTVFATLLANSGALDASTNLIPGNITNDGVTDNITTLNAFNQSLPKQASALSFPFTVTFTLSSADIALVAHGFRPNDAVVFSSTGSLPTGIVAGQIYYVISAGMALDTFRVSSTNNYSDAAGGEGAAITLTGSQSGTHSIRVLNWGWVTVQLPPGAYNSSNTAIVFDGGLRHLRVIGYGATLESNIALGPGLNAIGENASGFPPVQGAYLTDNTAYFGGLQATLANVADASKFWVNQWVCLGALDLQDRFGFQDSVPPNNFYYEFRKIQSLNVGTGAITFYTDPNGGGLKASYRAEYPTMYAGGTLGSTANVSGGGSAIMWSLPPWWDIELEYRGISWGSPADANIATPANGRLVKFVDCHFNSTGPFPSVSQRIIYDNCTFGLDAANASAPQIRIEVDKLIEFLCYKECVLDYIFFPSTITQSVFDKSRVGTIQGQSRLMSIRDSDIGIFAAGSLAYGVTDALTVTGSHVNNITLAAGYFRPYTNNPANFVGAYSFGSGTFQVPLSKISAIFGNANFAPNIFAVPGAKMFFADFAGRYLNMGSPFVILDTYTSGGNFCFDTTLSTVPVGNSTNGTVSISNSSPAIIGWTAHGLAAGTPILFTTSGTLASPLVQFQVYWVISAGLGANSFEISATQGGSAINTTTNGSLTPSAYSNPLAIMPHPCPRITWDGNTGAPQVLDLNGAVAEPMFSRLNRTYAGIRDTTIPSDPFYAPGPWVWGNISTMTVNVIKAYTGTSGTLTLTTSMRGFTGTLGASNLSQVIDCKLTGIRTVTGTGATGARGVDSISAYADWLSDTYAGTFNVNVESFRVAPIVQVIILTDQGVTKSWNLGMQGTQYAHAQSMMDTIPTGLTN